LPANTLDKPSAAVARNSDLAILFSIVAAVALLHVFTNNRYGFHRDELQFLSDARHLDWGFVPYPTPPPTTLIVIGLSSEQTNAIFTSCRWAGHNGNSAGVQNEESQDHPDIFVCGPPYLPWPELWQNHQDFG
jgi:hypothetical protein